MEWRKQAAGQPPGTDDLKRVMRQLGVLVDDPEALAQALDVLAVGHAAVAEAVARLRAEGYSDAELGRPLGVTRQAVRKRWPRAS